MKKKTEALAQSAAPLAYVGPTIPGTAVRGEVYTNGLPADLTEAAEKNPLLSKLIVELTEMPKAQRDILLKRGVYYAAYSSVNK